jgi:hypothetical protein
MDAVLAWFNAQNPKHFARYVVSQQQGGAVMVVLFVIVYETEVSSGAIGATADEAFAKANNELIAKLIAAEEAQPEVVVP